MNQPVSCTDLGLNSINDASNSSLPEQPLGSSDTRKPYPRNQHPKLVNYHFAQTFPSLENGWCLRLPLSKITQIRIYVIEVNLFAKALLCRQSLFQTPSLGL